MASGDTINVGLDFYFDDFQASVPARWSPALKWHYFALLNHLHKHGSVADDDYEIAVKSDLKPVGNYGKTVSKLRQKLCFHPEKPGFLTQARIHQDRAKYLTRREDTRKRVENHRAKKRVTEDGVTVSTPLTTPPTPVTETLKHPSIPSSNTESGPPDGVADGGGKSNSEGSEPGQVWEHVEWLCTVTGRKPRSIRSWLGQLAKDHGTDTVTTAVAACLDEAPFDPVGWITDACQRQNRPHWSTLFEEGTA